MIGRIFHYTFDAVLFSTVLAGVKRTTGYAADAQSIPLFADNPTVSSLFARYLDVGEVIFDGTASYAKRSGYFKLGDPKKAASEEFEKVAQAGWNEVRGRFAGGEADKKSSSSGWFGSSSK